MEDSLFRERGDDIGDLCKRVIRALLGVEHLLKTLPVASVIVAERLLPSDTMLLHERSVSAILVEHCGTSSHAAIFARGMGIPVASQINDAVSVIKTGEELLVDGITGRVIVNPDKSQKARFLGSSREYTNAIRVAQESCMEPAITQEGVYIHVLANVGNMEDINLALNGGAEGIGLYRLEQLYAGQKTLPDEDELFERLRKNLDDNGDRPVTIRLLDTGGDKQLPYLVYPNEENPMLGFRGASRYVDPSFQACFELECRALKYVREEMGLTNVQVMVPFVRSVAEASSVVDLLAANGLKRGENGLKVIMMCELPTNALLAEQYLQYFDGMSIGSNDMTQLTLGLDRDSGLVAYLFDERDEAVKAMLTMAIQACKKAGKYIGICGQGPSDHPDLALWLVEQGIDSISLNPDSVVETWLFLAGESV